MYNLHVILLQVRWVAFLVGQIYPYSPSLSLFFNSLTLFVILYCSMLWFEVMINEIEGKKKKKGNGKKNFTSLNSFFLPH